MPSRTELERLRRRLQAGRLDLPQTGRLGLELPAATPIFPLIPRTSEAQELGPPATAAPRRTPIRDALRRAAIGFAAGVAATPQQAGQAPGLGAAVGALSGLGQVFERERERRRKSEERLLEPARAERLEAARQRGRAPARLAEFERRRTTQIERDIRREKATRRRAKLLDKLRRENPDIFRAAVKASGIGDEFDFRTPQQKFDDLQQNIIILRAARAGKPLPVSKSQPKPKPETGRQFFGLDE